MLIHYTDMDELEGGQTLRGPPPKTAARQVLNGFITTVALIRIGALPFGFLAIPYHRGMLMTHGQLPLHSTTSGHLCARTQQTAIYCQPM
jgi:hypothetical protein